MNFRLPPAIHSKTKKHRYFLSRVWEPSKALVTFIGLNPSTADETQDDPTIRRCIGYAKAWGYGGLLMVNLFGLKSTDPKGLYKSINPVGGENDHWIEFAIRNSDKAVAAWGAHGKFKNRGNRISNEYPSLHVLGTNKDGSPKHPLYLKKDFKTLSVDFLEVIFQK